MVAGTSDLKWLLAENEIDIKIQALFFHFKFGTMKLFCGLGDTRSEVKDCLRDQFGLNVADGLRERQQVAAIQAVWDAAVAFVAKETAARAEARAGRYPRPVALTEQKAMRDVFELQFGKLERHLVPSMSYIGLKSDDVEEDEIRPEDLALVTSKADLEPDLLHPTIDMEGRLGIRRGSKNGHAPRNAEELRVKVALMGNCWLFLKAKAHESCLAQGFG